MGGGGAWPGGLRPLIWGWPGLHLGLIRRTPWVWVQFLLHSQTKELACALQAPRAGLTPDTLCFPPPSSCPSACCSHLCCGKGLEMGGRVWGGQGAWQRCDATEPTHPP